MRPSRRLRLPVPVRPRPLLAAIAMLATVACVGRAVPVEGAPPPEDEGVGGQSITQVVATLVVENSRMVDYRIYLPRRGGERLGMVSGPGRATFLLKGAQLPHTGELRVVAVPIADDEVLASAAYLPRGRTARFRIMPNGAYLIVDPLPPKPEPDSTAAPDTTKPPR